MDLSCPGHVAGCRERGNGDEGVLVYVKNCQFLRRNLFNVVRYLVIPDELS